MSFNSMEQIIEVCNNKNIDFCNAILQDDCKERGVSPSESMEQMKTMWNAMRNASDNYDASLTSKSGLVGGSGAKMMNYMKKKNELQDNSYCGDFVTEVIAEALKMGESNACMKCIVAAPTAGSCGVIPAVLIPYFKKYCTSQEDLIIKGLFVAAGIGQVIAERAFIAGAAGGCQAEIGAASAMAAGALVYIKKGTTIQISNAVAMSLKNLLGLVCDPVAGLVEVPCVKRNVIGSMNALSCADMAIAGIESAIPADQVIDAMREIGETMSSRYKETAQGGCAMTPAAKKVQSKMEALNI